MRTCLVTGAAVAVVVLTLGTAAPQAQPNEAVAQLDEFVPIESLPPADQLPAAPLLVIAYALAWVAVLGFVWVTWRRLGQIEDDFSRFTSAGRHTDD